jgi:hypothetical protein
LDCELGDYDQDFVDFFLRPFHLSFDFVLLRQSLAEFIIKFSDRASFGGDALVLRGLIKGALKVQDFSLH